MDKLLIGVYVLATAGGLILLKLGSTGAPFVSIIDSKILWSVTPVAVFGVLLYGLSFLIYLLLISKFNLGYIIPLTTGLVYTLIFVASFTIFKEGFTVTKIIAITLILTGVILLNTDSANKSQSKAAADTESLSYDKKISQ